MFEDFISALDAVSNARLTHQIINPPTLDYYLRAVFYDLQKTAPHYEFVLGILTTTMQNYYYPLLTQLVNCLYRYSLN